MNRIRNITLKIILLVFSLALGIFILETASKIILKTTKLEQKVKYAEDRLKDNVRRIGSFDEYLGWGYKPNASERCCTSDFCVDYSTNSKGFRDKETSVDKPSETFRIIALGESMVFGVGIDYGRRFTDVIENSLENVEVIDMGVEGFGADQSLLQLERDGLQFKADAVILFVIHDFFERCKLYQRGQIKPRFVLNDNKDDLVLQDANFIKNNIATSNNLETSQNRLKDIRKESVPSFVEKSNLFILLNSKEKLRDINKKVAEVDKRSWQDIFKQLREDSKKGIAYNDTDFERLIFLMLRRYQRICKDNSTDFILVYIDVDNEYFTKWLGNPIINLGINYLDLSSALREASNRNPLTFNIDPHYNEFTHRVIGEYVSNYFAKKYNLPRNKSYVYQ